MCKPGYHFKFCTCATEDIDEENCWRLMRFSTANGAINMPIGLICFPRDDLRVIMTYLQHKILEDLNQYSVFDFDYAPLEGDTLEVTMDGREFHFKYENGKFVEGEVDYDIPMEELAEGCINF